MTKFKVGDRVRYSREATDGYDPGHRQVGTIVSTIHSTNFSLRVVWDGFDAEDYFVYTDDELELAENGLDVMFRTAFEDV